MDVQNKLVLITGGSSGIGFALANALLQQRAKVIILGQHADQLEAALTELGGRSPNLDGYAFDIASPELVSEFGKIIQQQHGAPDLLINNAGFAIYETFHQHDLDSMERLAQVNFLGALRITKVFLDKMIARRSGHIVNVASIGGVIPITPNAVYCAAKHGMVAWSRCLATELARFGVFVSVICPGRTETRFFDHPSFQARRHRKETELTVTVDQIVAATLHAVRRRKFMTFVPRYLGVLAWAYSSLGPLIRIPLDRLMRARIDDLYREQEHQ